MENLDQVYVSERIGAQKTQDAGIARIPGKKNSKNGTAIRRSPPVLLCISIAGLSGGGWE